MPRFYQLQVKKWTDWSKKILLTQCSLSLRTIESGERAMLTALPALAN
jgi:hypothetical protein